MSLLLDALKQAEENKKKASEDLSSVPVAKEMTSLALEESVENIESTVEITLEKQEPTIELEEPKEPQIELGKPVYQATHERVNVIKKRPPVNVLSVGQKQKKGSSYRVVGLIVVLLLALGVAGMFFLDQGESPDASYKEMVAAQRKSLAKETLAVNTLANKSEVIAVKTLESPVEEELLAITEVHQVIADEFESLQGSMENPSAIQIKKRTTPSSLLDQLDGAYRALVGNDLVRAKVLYSQILKKRPKQTSALLGLANIERQRSNELLARQLYQRVLRMDKANSIAQIGLLQTYGRQDAISRQQVLEELVTKYGNNPEVHLALGHALSEQAKWMFAQQSYFNAFSLNSKSTVYAYNLAVSLDRLGKFGAAKTYYETAFSLNEQSIKPMNLQRVTNRLKELNESYE